MNRLLPAVVVPPGRLLLSIIFLLSALYKITAWDSTTQRMSDQGLAYVHLFLAGAVALELIGGLSLLLGLWARLGSLLLILFLIPTTLIFHDFWTLEGEARQTQMTHFLKNLAILGGLLIVLGFGAGPLSLTGKKATPSGE